jgi:hypothetical protein
LMLVRGGWDGICFRLRMEVVVFKTALLRHVLIALWMCM